MPASKKNMGPSSRRPWKDPDDAPELDDAFFERAEIRDGDRIVRRGRPPLKTTKQPVTLRLDRDIVAHFKAEGAGWQTRINEALRRAVTRRARAVRALSSQIDASD